MEAQLSSLIDLVKAQGFIEAGVVNLDLSREAIAPHIDRYRSWIENGQAGEMDYLKRGLARREDPRLVFSKTQSILCALYPYNAAPFEGRPSPSGHPAPRYARYARGRDYHEVVAEKLEAALRQFCTNLPEDEPTPFEWKICVDTSAVLERSWSSLAGLGKAWIGKNTLLIHPQKGSYTLIGVALLSRSFNSPPTQPKNLCGGCTRCIDACPTGALSLESGLDSRRCISYWTLEKRGELDIPPELKSKISPWVAGCDICQEACPFNLKVSRSVEYSLKVDPGAELGLGVEVDPLEALTVDDLLKENEGSYRDRTKGSALNHLKYKNFIRNLNILTQSQP